MNPGTIWYRRLVSSVPGVPHRRCYRCRLSRDPTGIVRIPANPFGYPKFGIAWRIEHRPLFRPRSLALGFERGNPCFRCHSKSQPEKFNEGARLPIPDLGGNRFYRTPCNQQLYSFHQTHLPSPKLEAHPDFSSESSLNCPDAYTDFSTQRIQGWSICLVCEERFSDTKCS